MGAWDSGPFDNDDAADFAARVEDAPGWATVKDALQSALRSDYLEAPQASEAVAAAAFVAAAHSGDADLVTEERASVLKVLGAAPADLRVLATEALTRVAGDSELAELWNESEDGAKPWLAHLSAIGARL